MEIIQVKKLFEFKPSKVIRKVPLMTDEFMTAILFIDAHTTMSSLKHKHQDKVHYVISGEGKIEIGSECKKVTDGMLILIPKGKLYRYITFEKQLTILSISSFKSSEDDPIGIGVNGENT